MGRRQVSRSAPSASASLGRSASASASLDTEKIVDAALFVIDAKGLAALSMRAIGQVLGTSAMALYFHFSSKDELLTAVGLRLVARVPAFTAPDLEGAGRARTILTQLREVRAKHPNAYALVATELGRSCATLAGRAAWAASWPGLSASRADLLRITLVPAAAEPAALDAELIALFFGYTGSP